MITYYENLLIRRDCACEFFFHCFVFWRRLAYSVVYCFLVYIAYGSYASVCVACVLRRV